MRNSAFRETLIGLTLIAVFWLVQPTLIASGYSFDPLSEPPIGEIPQWAKTVVWYQIFPERFGNGDLSNDPTLDDIRGAYPDDDISPWQVHPWTSDWYELQPYEQANQQGLDFNLSRRRYGGDLQGIIDRLDYLKSLGVGALYLNPVFQSPSEHKYDPSSFHHIDPNFGPDPEGDRQIIAQEIPDNAATWIWTAADQLFLELIQEAHARNIRIIIDGVFNHIGDTSRFFQNLKESQEFSKYKDWFDIFSWDDQDSEFSYKSWWGIESLPELRKDENGLVNGPKWYTYASTKRWMDPNQDGDPSDGIDGWRLDVATGLPHRFWKDWRRFVKYINPEAYLVAELFGEPDALAPYLLGDEFDAIMNYRFAFLFTEHYIEKAHPISMAEFDQQLRDFRGAFGLEIAHAMQNLFSSHDVNRLASHIVNREAARLRDEDWNVVLSKVIENPDYITRKPNLQERQLQKLATLYQMTYLGAPMIYYGDEAGMWGANTPDNRKPMVWYDLTYAPEQVCPDGGWRDRPDPVEFDWEMFKHYQHLIAIHNQYPALQLGSYRTILLNEARSLYGYEREYEGERVIVILNGSDTAQVVTLDLSDANRFVEVLNDSSPQVSQTQLTVEVPPVWGNVLVAH
ncbi:MAG: alpha-amylase [Cyanothece sp. SIO2G6]|nr:alpha-amylase [Cyanothece sp. SIO2G6]